MQPPELPIGLYLRISEDPLHLRAGVTRQRVDCLAIAETRWPGHPVQVYEDNDKGASKYSRKKRPAYMQLCEDVKNGMLYAVVGWDFDRMFRKNRELEDFIDLCEATGFKRAITAQGDVDLTTDDGQLHARIMVSVAAKEAANTSRRVRRQLQDKRERGLHDGKGIVYGYRLVDGVPVPQPQQANVVRKAAGDLLHGASLAAIARNMPPGAPRTSNGVRKMLLSRTHIGVNNAGVKGVWPPIIDVQTYADVQAILTDPARRSTGPRGTRTWWLSGMVYCECGGRMKVHTNGQHRVSYVCYKGCNRVGILAVRLLAHVELEMFAVVQALEPISSESVDVTEQADDVVVARMTELAADYATGAITRAEWVAARNAVESRLMVPVTTVPHRSLRPVPDLPARWDSWTPQERHAQAARVIERVVVSRAAAGHWDPRRIRVHWRT